MHGDGRGNRLAVQLCGSGALNADFGGPLAFDHNRTLLDPPAPRLTRFPTQARSPGHIMLKAGIQGHVFAEGLSWDRAARRRRPKVSAARHRPPGT